MNDKRIKHFNQKYDISFSYFDNPNTELFAYFLGFFYADGYNNEKQGGVTITLNECDSELLEQFSKIFFGNRPIKKYNIKCQTNQCNAVCSLSIKNRELSKILSSFGAGQNKTFSIQIPPWLDDNLLRHFVRGYFDGDGSISRHKNEFRISIAGNILFNTQLQNVLKTKLDLKFGIIHQGKITILFKGGNRNSKKFLDWIYNNATLYLPRKYERYMELLTQIKKVDNFYSHVSYRKSRNYWQYRLPSKYGRKIVGGFSSKEDAINAYNSCILEL